MDTVTLESLLIDRALGAFSPDVEQLLAAYLTQDAEAAAVAGQFVEVADLAKHSLAARTTVPLPPFPLQRILRAERAGRNRRCVGAAVAAAACVLMGLGLGAGMFRGSPTTESDDVAVSESQVPSDVTAAGDDSNKSTSGDRREPGFWSVKLLRERALAMDRSRPSRPSWRTLLKSSTVDTEDDNHNRGNLWELRHEIFNLGG